MFGTVLYCPIRWLLLGKTIAEVESGVKVACVGLRKTYMTDRHVDAYKKMMMLMKNGGADVSRMQAISECMQKAIEDAEFVEEQKKGKA